jgi:hypothetical protein
MGLGRTRADPPIWSAEMNARMFGRVLILGGSAREGVGGAAIARDQVRGVPSAGGLAIAQLTEQIHGEFRQAIEDELGTG